jgi:hypothetical protein
MRTCECPAACSGIRSEASWQDRLDVDRGLPVPELADVEVVPPMCGEQASPEQWFEHRRLRLLDPEKERVSVVATEEQHHPGACSDTPDADDFRARSA